LHVLVSMRNFSDLFGVFVDVDVEGSLDSVPLDY